MGEDDKSNMPATERILRGIGQKFNLELDLRNKPNPPFGGFRVPGADDPSFWDERVRRENFVQEYQQIPTPDEDTD
jgi:hypothetical protein